MAKLIVESFVQQKNFGGFEAQNTQLPAQLLEGVGAKPARNEGADVLGAKLDLDGASGVERESHVTHGPEMMADGAALAIGSCNQRIPFPLSQSFQAVGAVGLPGDSVPKPCMIGATATWDLREDAVGGR
jgi:hypothetical protein